jgi:oligoendopeptidase F
MLPVWKTTNLFPALGTLEFKKVLEDYSARISETQKTLKLCLDEGAPARSVLELIPRLEGLVDLHESLESYTYMGFSVDTASAETGAAMDELDQRSLPLKELENSLLRLLSHQDFSSELIMEVLGDLRYEMILAEARVEAQHLMSEAEESLANDMMRSGGTAWSKLHSSLSSSLTALWEEGEGQSSPEYSYPQEAGEKNTAKVKNSHANERCEKTVVELRQLASHGDRKLRRKAYEKELELWKSHELAFAAALNGVKGQSLTVESRRNWSSNLQKSLFQSRFSPKALECMIGAMEDALGDFRRYFGAKAKSLGLEKLAFYDLFAPLPGAEREWTFPEAKDFITRQFDQFSPRMGDFARKAFENQWIHAPLQKGKVGGAYCTYLPTAGESRLLINYLGSFNDIRTLAHEMGHAYHFEILHRLPAQLRVLPMPLAETASIFSETLIFEKPWSMPRQRRPYPSWIHIYWTPLRSLSTSSAAIILNPGSLKFARTGN